MGGRIDDDGGREVQPATLPANPLWDPHWKGLTLGRDPSLPTLCACGANLGIHNRTSMDAPIPAAVRNHRCGESKAKARARLLRK